jgi:hypothetical protein
MAVGALVTTAKRSSAAMLTVNANAAYTRTVICTTDGGTAGTANLTGFIVPKNTMILALGAKFSVAQGEACTYVFQAGTTDLNTACLYNHTDFARPTAFVPYVTTADTQMCYTTADAANVVAELEITVTLVAVGQDLPRCTSTGN